MPLSNTVLRQYTPPTCTLEITARTSPLSRGVKRSVTELLRFVLRFDDPRLPELEPVTVTGDRHQFAALQTAVTAYVQDWLKQPPEHFNAMVGATPSSPEVPVSSAPEASRLSSPNSASAHPHPQESASQLTAAPFGKIFLQPASSGLAHNLFLGPLETEKGTSIQLSVLQLFDLVTALDECAADLVELPAGSRRDLASPPFAWASIAAILLLVVGVTTAVVLFLNRTNSQKQIATTTVPPSPSSNTPPPPTALQPSPLPTLSATPLPSLSPSEKLPLPPSTRTSVPSPSSSKGVPGANIPEIGTAPPNQLPGLIAPPPPPSNLTAPRQDRSSIFLPDIAPVPKASNGHPRSKNGQRQPTTGNPTPEAALPGSNNLPILTPSNPNLGAGTSPNPGELRDNTQLPRALTPPDISKGTAFDSIPQIAEARNYFKQRWEPPSGLTQTLEYSLRLDTDGTIQRIIPLGEAARKYVDRSGMPLVGEHFVSPTKNGQTPTIRVVLSPDGQVQAFLEST